MDIPLLQNNSSLEKYKLSKEFLKFFFKLSQYKF